MVDFVELSQDTKFKTLCIGCVIAQAFFSHRASAISLKSRVFSAEFSVI